MDIVSHYGSNLNAALAYASLGYRVFPIHGFLAGSCTCCRTPCPGTSKPGKHPACPHGCKDGTTEEQTIRGWFGGKPWLNVGIAPDADVLVLDIDPAKGGSESLARWEAEHGALPSTPKVETGSKGFHYYFRLPDGVRVKNTSSEFAPGIDLRSLGGYLVAPPSLHECGGRYEWLEPLETPLALAPDWLVSIVAEKPTPASAPSSSSSSSLKFKAVVEDEAVDFASHPGAPEGRRRKECCRLAGIHADRGDSLKTVEAVAAAWAKRCSPPYPEAEALTHVRGIFAKEGAKAELNSFPSQEPEVEGPPLSPSPLLSSPEQEPMAGDEGAGLDRGSAAIKPAVAVVPSEEPDVEPGVVDWPTLSPEAYYGLAGEIVKAVAPETEADPVGILLSLLTAFGSAVGRGPHFAFSGGFHHANLFSALVGDTASGKGQAWGIVQRLMAKAESEWAGDSIAYGLSSGEGLVERLKDGEEEEEPAEKRLLCLETEFARPITAMRREGNTLSPILRSAWDCQTLEVMTRGKNKLKASNAYTSVIAHVTPEELQEKLGDSVDIANGFSNRFVWTLVRRSKVLPEGGDPCILSPFIGPMAEAIVKAKSIARVERDDEAKALWAEVYEGLSTAKPGAFGKATSRGHAQTLRLSLLYALLDGSSVITASHLRAALAVWRYCEDSARLIFGSCSEKDKGGGRGVEVEPSLDFRLLQAIEAAPGVKRTDLLQATASRKRGEVPEALASLQAKRLAHPRQCQSEGAGRPSECWYPGPEMEPGGMKFGAAQEEDGGDEGGASLTRASPASKGADAIGPSEEPSSHPGDQGREVGDGKEFNSPTPEQGELNSFPSQLPSGGGNSEPGELNSFPSQLPSGEQEEGNSAKGGGESEAEESTPPPSPFLSFQEQEEESMPGDHLEAVAEWRRVLEARVSDLLHGEGKVEPEDIPCLEPGWAEAAAKRLYRSALRTAPDKRNPLPVPKGHRPEVKGWLEGQPLGWLHRKIRGDIASEAKAKALSMAEMPEEEFMRDLVDGLEAIEKANTDKAGKGRN